MSTKDYVEAQNPAIFMHLNEKNLIPDYVMESERVTTAETDGLSVVAFADPVTRAYPCHTKSACWQSAAWYAGTSEGRPDVKANIEKMAAAHGISDDVQAVFDSFADDLEKSAAATAEIVEEPQYALSLDLNGYQGRGYEQYYPVSSHLQVLTSCDNAATDFLSGLLPMPVMRKVATTLIKAAEAHAVQDCDIPGVVRRLGVVRLPDPYAAELLIDMRKTAGVDTAPYVRTIVQLRDSMAKAANAQEAILLAEDAASEVYDMDCENNIHYSGRMLNPYEILFSGPRLDELEKAAAQVVDVLNVHVPVVDFLNLSDEKIDSYFSPEAAETIKKAKAQVEGSPDMEKTASAAQLLAMLPDAVNKVLLGVLAETAW